MPIRVRVGGRMVEFPDGTPEQEMRAALDSLPVAPRASHEPEPPQDYAQFGPMQSLLKDQAEGGVHGRGLPEAAATVAAMASGGGVALPAIAAGGAGYLGARLRGDSREDAAITGGAQGALTGGFNLAGKGVMAAGQMVKDRAVPLVRSALKPAFADLRRRAGIEGATPSALADRQAKFIIDRQLKTPEQAAALVKSSGAQVDDAIKAAESNPNASPVLDTATRVPRYLESVLRRVERQIMPGKDRAAIQAVGREVVEDSPLSQNVASTSRKSPPNPAKTEGLNSRPLGAPKPPEPAARPRALRANIRPSEGAEIVRSKSFFDKDASGGTIAGGKAVERAVRDSIKESVPAARGPLQTQGRALDAERLLDRASWRDGNRDTMPGGMGAIAGIANGRPLLGLLMQALKEGQLSAGLAAPAAGQGIQRMAPAVSHGQQGVRLLQMLLGGQE